RSRSPSASPAQTGGVPYGERRNGMANSARGRALAAVASPASVCSFFIETPMRSPHEKRLAPSYGGPSTASTGVSDFDRSSPPRQRRGAKTVTKEPCQRSALSTRVGLGLLAPTDRRVELRSPAWRVRRIVGRWRRP